MRYALRKLDLLYRQYQSFWNLIPYNEDPKFIDRIKVNLPPLNILALVIVELIFL